MGHSRTFAAKAISMLWTFSLTSPRPKAAPCASLDASLTRWNGFSRQASTMTKFNFLATTASRIQLSGTNSSALSGTLDIFASAAIRELPSSIANP